MVKTRINIEKLVTWALRDQGLGWVGRGQSADLGGDIALLGTRVDVTHSPGLPAPGVGLNDSDDALIVKSAIDQLPPDGAALVVQYGRVGLRPDWGEEGYGRPEQLKNRRGQPQWDYRDPKNRRGKIGPKLDWRGYEHHVAQIDYERAAWTVWREALAALVPELDGQLSGYSVTGPEVPAAPWTRLIDDGPVAVPWSGSIAAKRAMAADRGVGDRPTDTSIPATPRQRPQKSA